MNERYFVAVDVGQACDPTAIAVVERTELLGDYDPVAVAYRKVIALRLRYLQRMELGTPYQEVAVRVADITHNSKLYEKASVSIDATGVGRPVVELLKAAGPSCAVTPVIVTGGDAENYADGYYRVPKRDLIVGLQLLMQRHLLFIAEGIPDGAALVKEMMDMRVKVGAGGREQYGAWREGTHDDLVFAVALACWDVRRSFPEHPPGDETYWAGGLSAGWVEKFKEAMKDVKAWPEPLPKRGGIVWDHQLRLY